MADLLSSVLGTDLVVPASPETTREWDKGNTDGESNKSHPIAEDRATSNSNGMDETSDDGTNHRVETLGTEPTHLRKSGSHRAQRLADCRDFLTKWRYKHWKEDHSDNIWGPSIVLPDCLITKFASSAWVKSVEDVRHEFGSWMWIDEYSKELLEGLEVIDQKYEEMRKEKEEEKRRQKAEQQAERERKVAEARCQAEERKEQAKKRKAEEQVRKQEEKKRQKRIAIEERQRAQIEAEERQLVGETEMERHQRTGHNAALELDLSPQVQDPLPPRPRPRPRPRPTKKRAPVQGQENSTAHYETVPGCSSVMLIESDFAPPPYSPPGSAIDSTNPAISSVPYILYENSFPHQSELSPAVLWNNQFDTDTLQRKCSTSIYRDTH